jgi:hypothetical protein
MNSDKDTRYRVGCPIRRSRDHRSLASPPGFSQRATSFIASQCQGIHQMPFSLRLMLITPPRTGAKPGSPRQRGAGPRETCPCESRERGPMHAQAASHEDTSADRRTACAAPIRLGHMTKLSLHPSINPCAAALTRNAVAFLLQTSDWYRSGGGERIRTDDLLLAKQALSQLSYTPRARDQKTEVRSVS